MADTGVPHPPTTKADDARRQLESSGFSQLPGDPKRPHTQFWKNRNNKVVAVDFTDESFEVCWTESLATALREKETIPAHPWSPWWVAILGKDFRPS